jgi:hypothetical protein
MRSRRALSLWLFAALLVFLTVAAPVQAGNGNLRSGEYNFCVSVRFNATPAQLTSIRTAFANGSQIFADATDGQQRFGTIKIVNDSGASDTAEYWVNAGPGRAYATFGEYGVRGQHINLFMDSNFGGGDGDAYTVAHEHAHHAFGVADEYSGPGFLGLFSVDAECAAGPDDANLDFCLMDNYFTRGGNAAGVGGGFTLNEFCVAGNHDPDSDTYQESRNGESCWETISSHPTRALPATFVDGFGGLRVMLVLDRSGSMLAQNRLTFAKRGAGTFLRFLRTGDSVGVASFDCSTALNFPLTTITGGGTTAAASGVINALAAGGSTNIGGGLQTALNAITAQPNRSCNEIIVLLSDGDHNCGVHPAAVVPALQAEGVTVFAIGVGSGISPSGQGTLQGVAALTGGRYFQVSNAFDLVGLFLRLSFESIGGDLLARSPLALAPQSTVEIPVFVEAGAAQATFALAFENASSNVSLSLRSPSGTIFTSSSAQTIQGDNFIALQVGTPEPGEWTMIVTTGSVASGNAETLAFAEHDGVQLTAAVADNTVEFPQVVEIRATPRYEGENVVNATVTGFVIRPGGSQVPIQLFDEGSSAHGDAVVGDGVYSARFNDYNDDGTYTFELTVHAEGSSIYAGESLFLHAGHPSNQRPAPTFVRSTSTTAVVTGVPDFIVGTAEIGPETINLKSNGRFVTAYLELPAGFDVAGIAIGSVLVTAVDGQAINPVPAEAHPTEIGDFDNDGTADLMVKFDRGSLQQALAPGSRTIRIEGNVAGRLFIAEREVLVIEPGKP